MAKSITLKIYGLTNLTTSHFEALLPNWGSTLKINVMSVDGLEGFKLSKSTDSMLF